MARTIVVVPNHLPHLDFLKEWTELADVEIIVVQDIGDKPEAPLNVTVYDHSDIKDDLGKHAWIIPTQSSACRSYGYYKAWQRHPRHIITLDNDCYPEKQDDYWISGHEDALAASVTLDWWDTTYDIHARGFPYLIRDRSHVYLNHGLWSNVPDLDAPTSLHHPDLRFGRCRESRLVPRYNFFPMCGMNLSWRAELTPAMYFGLFGPEHGFDQYDDIWAGVIVKRILDHLGYAAKSGYPSVEHRKQSNVFVNLMKQAPGMAANEEFWRHVQRAELSATNVPDCYGQIIAQLPDDLMPEWMPKFKKAALTWLRLFQS